MSIRRDDGIATIWAVTAVGVIMLVAALALYLGGAIVARHRAESAADLAALAAAGQSVFGTDVACQRAADIATAMDARLAGCRLDGWDALVEVRVGVPELGLLPDPAVAVGRAKAGPPRESTASDAEQSAVPHEPLETTEAASDAAPLRAPPPAARSSGTRRLSRFADSNPGVAAAALSPGRCRAPPADHPCARAQVSPVSAVGV